LPPEDADLNPPVTTPSQPKAIGRYRIDSLLGMGAMGVVYRAHDPRLQRDVAVKMLRLLDDDPARHRHMTEKLLTEARLVARLKHPGIVPVFDAGVHDGKAFMVTELVDGTPLETVLAGKASMDPAYAVNLMRQILEAIADAHQNEVIHRDIKPANVMIQSGGQVRVMDFGIAHALDGSGKRPAERCAGTPRYMAPEQFLGQPVDPRTDLFSCGVTLYQMLTGKRPFDSKDFESLREQVVNQPHPKLHAAQARVSPQLSAVVDTALAKRPRERFASAAKMIEALMACPESAAAAGASAGNNGEQTSRDRKEILDFIRKRIERKGDFPAISSYVARVTAAARSVNSSAQLVAEAILKDFSLTNRVLRMVNSPFYRGVRKPVTTISRAVVILGMDTIIGIAGGLSIFEHFSSRADVPELKRQTVLALMTALHARRVATDLPDVDAEEAFICGMLNNLGRLIVAFYFPEEFQAINDLLKEGETSEDNAARRVMGISFSELGRAMAEHWNFSDMTQAAMGGLEGDRKGRLVTDVERMQGVVSFASELGRATLIENDVHRKAALDELSREFEGIIDIRPKRLGEIIHDSLRNAWDISHNVRVDLKQLGVAGQLLDRVRKEGGHDAAAADAAAPPDGRSTPGDRAAGDSPLISGQDALEQPNPSITLSDPLDDTDPGNPDSEVVVRQDVIMKTIMELTTTMMNPFDISDVFMMVLEGLCRGVGYRHVMLAMINPGRDHIVYRFGLGDGIEALGEKVNMPLDESAGALGLCIREKREIVIVDTHDPRYNNSIPRPLHEILGRASVALIPLVVQNRAIGLFFLDRGSDQPPLNAQTLRDSRALTGQAILAIMQSMTRNG
jgi:serine/threonine protein kinase